MKHIMQQKIFSVEECNKIINCKSTISNDGGNQRFDLPPMSLINDNEENNWIRKRLEDVLSKINKRHYRFKDTAVYDKIGVRTYNSGEGFKWHLDGGLAHEVQVGKEGHDQRRLTAILFLNNDYTGGDLRIFCGEDVVIKNNIGVLVVFPSWYFHQADKVLSGVRKVLITWFIGPKF